MQSLDRQKALAEAEKRLKAAFRDKSLLDCALVHASYVNEHRGEKREHNERLEFLGDAVLELVATESLYKTFASTGEGVLTSLRAALVKGDHLARVANELHLGEYLLLSRGEEKCGGRRKDYILANALEAVIGAIYLDRGFNAAHKFIDKFILVRLEDILKQGAHVDAKSRLQEISQGKWGITPVYEVLSESGPDHNKVFETTVLIGDKAAGRGRGSSKQKAQEQAAKDALENLKL